MVNRGLNIQLTLTQQTTFIKLQTKLDALKVQRDEMLQDINELIQMASIELGVPQGAAFDKKSMSFSIPQAEKQQKDAEVG